MWQWVKDLVSDAISAIGNLFKDLFVWIFGLFVDVIIYVVDLIPLPNALIANSASELIHPDIGYFLGVTGFGNCLAVLGAAFLFRIIRRFVTLGIW